MILFLVVASGLYLGGARRAVAGPAFLAGAGLWGLLAWRGVYEIRSGKRVVGLMDLPVFLFLGYAAWAVLRAPCDSFGRLEWLWASVYGAVFLPARHQLPTRKMIPWILGGLVGVALLTEAFGFLHFRVGTYPIGPVPVLGWNMQMRPDYEQRMSGTFGCPNHFGNYLVQAEWVRLHQLVVRSAAVLGRKPDDGRQFAAQFLRADAALIDIMDTQLRALDAEAALFPRAACDIEAVDIRVLEVDWRREYQLQSGVWQLVPVQNAPTQVRIVSGQPAPTQICVMTRTPGEAPLARLQIRQLLHSRCNQDTHPQLSHAGAHGLSVWLGHMAQSVSWVVPALPAASRAAEAGLVLIEETFPDITQLRMTTCGLRDEGIPFGVLQTYIYAYQAHQYFFTWNREPSDELSWPRAIDRAEGNLQGRTKCRAERDGRPIPCSDWEHGFDVSLNNAVVSGLDRLFSAWQQTTQVAAMKSTMSLLNGHAALTWGWREGAQGLVGLPFMRLAGELDLNNLISLELSGEVTVGETRTRVRLFVQGECPARQILKRESELPGLFEVLSELTMRWKLKFQLEFDPLAVETASLWCEAGPCSGSLNGEIGLRPKISGGSGWQWFVRLHTDAVSVPIGICDPVLGLTFKTVPLLPSMDLLNWSIG